MKLAQTQPTIVNGGLSTIAGAITAVLVLAGVNADDANKVVLLVLAVVALIVAVQQQWANWKKVTPLAHPKSANGIDLVEAADGVWRAAQELADGTIAGGVVPAPNVGDTVEGDAGT